MNQLVLRRAGEGDVRALAGLRDDASRWLTARGLDQWASDWPDSEQRLKAVVRSVKAGETWCVTAADRVIATIGVDHVRYPGLWTKKEEREPAGYAHRLIVSREYAHLGLGAELLDWAGSEAARAGERWLRLDVWTTNTALQRYYVGQGFTHVRTVVRDDYPSGALFQRAAKIRPARRLGGVVDWAHAG